MPHVGNMRRLNVHVKGRRSLDRGARIRTTPHAVPKVEGAGETHEITIGAVPNLAGRARKGAALVRVLRTTTICVAKHLLTDQFQNGRPEGK